CPTRRMRRCDGSMSWSECPRPPTPPFGSCIIGDIDVTELLPQVAVPTLVVHSRRDARVPFEHGLMLAREIRDARFVALESKNHLILSHEPAWQRFIDAITDFLRSEEAPQR